MLAGVSIDYYARLERGRLAGASEEVLDALSRALQLHEAERAHLHDLAAGRRHRPPRRAVRRAKAPVSANLTRVLDSMTDAPAFIRNGRLDILAVNPLGRALYAPVFSGSARPVTDAPSGLVPHASAMASTMQSPRPPSSSCVVGLC